MSRDFFYDETTKDLTLTDGKDLKFTDNIIDYTIQKLEKVLNFVFGEWYLNRTLGIPYLALDNNDRDDNTKNILVKNPDISFINTIFISAIAGIDTVDEIVNFESELNTNTREFDINYAVKLINGNDLANTVNIGVL